MEALSPANSLPSETAAVSHPASSEVGKKKPSSSSQDHRLHLKLSTKKELPLSAIVFILVATHLNSVSTQGILVIDYSRVKRCFFQDQEMQEHDVDQIEINHYINFYPLSRQLISLLLRLCLTKCGLQKCSQETFVHIGKQLFERQKQSVTIADVICHIHSIQPSLFFSGNPMCNIREAKEIAEYFTQKFQSGDSKEADIEANLNQLSLNGPQRTLHHKKRITLRRFYEFLPKREKKLIAAPAPNVTPIPIPAPSPSPTPIPEPITLSLSV